MAPPAAAPELHQPNAALVGAFRSAGRVAGLLAAGVGAVVMGGWATGLESVKSVLPGLATMKFNTAAGLALAGGSAAALASDPPGRAALWAARAAALLALSIGGSNGLEWLAGIDLGIDQLVVREGPGAIDAPVPGRMAPATALCLALLGAALLGTASRRSALERAGPPLGLAVGAMSGLALVGYFFGVPTLYRVTAYSSMALHTSATLLLLAVAVLCIRPERWPTGVLVSASAGGIVARRMLLPVLLLPVTVGWLRLRGELAGFYGTEFGLALMVLSSSAILVGLLWLSAHEADAVDLERRTAQRQLDEAAERLHATFEQAAAGLAQVAPDGCLLQVNGKLCQILGYPRAELVGRVLHDLSHADDLAADREHHQRMLAGELQSFAIEKRYLRKDGSPVWVNLTVSLVRHPGGSPKYFVSVVEDITERKRIEQEVQRLNQELEQRVVERTAQLEAANRELEAFSYSVSHDLRAPLRHLSGFAELLAQRLGDELDPAATRYLRTIGDSAAKMGRMIDELLAFSRTGRVELYLERVDMGELVRGVVRELEPTLGERRVVWTIGELPAVRGHAPLLRMALANLLGNAIKFTAPRAEAHISVTASRDAAGHPLFCVADDGVGFDSRYAHKLFGVFQRLHREEEFPGTGIGLATVQRIVARHGGEIRAEGAVDRGARFYFSLRGEEVAT